MQKSLAHSGLLPQALPAGKVPTNTPSHCEMAGGMVGERHIPQGRAATASRQARAAAPL